MQTIQKKLLIVGIAFGCLSVRGSDSVLEVVSAGSVDKPNVEKQKLGTEGLGHREVRAVSNDQVKDVELKKFELSPKPQASRLGTCIKRGAVGLGLVGVVGAAAQWLGMIDNFPEALQETDFQKLVLASGCVYLATQVKQDQQQQRWAATNMSSLGQAHETLQTMYQKEHEYRVGLQELTESISTSMKAITDRMITAEEHLSEDQQTLDSYDKRITELENIEQQRKDDLAKSSDQFIDDLTERAMKRIKSRPSTPTFMVSGIAAGSDTNATGSTTTTTHDGDNNVFA